jgi:hypothetical protein
MTRERDPRIPPPRRVEQPAPQMPPKTGKVGFCFYRRLRHKMPIRLTHPMYDFNFWVRPDVLGMAIKLAWTWP